MSVELIFELAWKSVLLSGLALLMLRVLRQRSPAERSWIANAGLASLLLLPLTVVAGPRWSVSPPETVTAVLPKIATPALPLAEAEPTVASSAISTAPALPTWTVPEVGLGWILALPAGLLAMLLLVAVLRLYRLRSRAEVLVEPQWSTALSAAQRRMRFKHGTALLVSDELRSPISWGVVRPIILLDRNAASDASQAEAIIAHELAHVARLDWAMLIVGRLATALNWFNPLAWVLARRAHELSEQAVDDSVLNSNIASTDYAQLLISTACHDNSAVVLAANGVAGCGPLTRRVERVLDPAVSRSAARRTWALGCSAAMICIAGPVSALAMGEQPGATPRDVEIQEAGRTIVIRDGSMEIRGEVVDTSNIPARNLAPRLAPVPGASPTLEKALVSAASEGDVAAVRQLIAQGVNVNASVEGDGTPLIAAARTGRRDMVDLLLSKGANIDMGADGDGNPLIAAAAAGHLGIVQHLLDRGANIEAVVLSDENALMQASYHGHEAIVRLLMRRGADVNSRVGRRTPVVMAMMGGHPNIAALLRGAGATG